MEKPSASYPAVQKAILVEVGLIWRQSVAGQKASCSWADFLVLAADGTADLRMQASYLNKKRAAIGPPYSMDDIRRQSPVTVILTSTRAVFHQEGVAVDPVYSNCREPLGFLVRLLLVSNVWMITFGRLSGRCGSQAQAIVTT